MTMEEKLRLLFTINAKNHYSNNIVMRNCQSDLELDIEMLMLANQTFSSRGLSVSAHQTVSMLTWTDSCKMRYQVTQSQSCALLVN